MNQATKKTTQVKIRSGSPEISMNCCVNQSDYKIKKRKRERERGWLDQKNYRSKSKGKVTQIIKELMSYIGLICFLRIFSCFRQAEDGEN